MCVYDGDTFVGTFFEIGRGSDTTVTVRFHGAERTGPVGSFGSGPTAQRLLRDLVRDRLAVEGARAA